MSGTHHQGLARGGRWALASGRAWEWPLLAYVCFKGLVSSGGITVCLLKGFSLRFGLLETGRSHSVSSWPRDAPDRRPKSWKDTPKKAEAWGWTGKDVWGRPPSLHMRENSQGMERQSTVHRLQGRPSVSLNQGQSTIIDEKDAIQWHSANVSHQKLITRD